MKRCCDCLSHRLHPAPSGSAESQDTVGLGCLAGVVSVEDFDSSFLTYQKQDGSALVTVLPRKGVILVQFSLKDEKT